MLANQIIFLFGKLCLSNGAMGGFNNLVTTPLVGVIFKVSCYVLLQNQSTSGHNGVFSGLGRLIGLIT